MSEPRRVLVVEDNDISRDLLCEQLQLLGLAAEGAGSAADALARAAEHTYDIVFIDLGLPDGSGLDVVRTLRASAAPPVRIIAVSGHADEGTRGRALAAGCGDYAVKPLRRADLMRLLADGSELPRNEPPATVLESVFADSAQRAAMYRLAADSLAGYAVRLHESKARWNTPAATLAAHQALTVALDAGADELAALARTIETHVRTGAWTEAGRDIDAFASQAETFRTLVERRFA